MAEKHKTKKHFLLWIDILGYRERVKKSPRDVNKYLNTVKKAMDYAKLTGGSKPLFGMSGPMMRMFSDNIIVYLPVPRGEKMGTLFQIEKMLTIAGLIKMSFMTYHNLLVRGSFVVGNFYADNDFVFGPAIIEAYDMERTAKYPRIVVSEEIYNIMDRIKSKDKTFMDFETAISEDFDGQKYVTNVLKSVQTKKFIENYFEKEIYLSWIRDEKIAIEKIIRDYYKNTNLDALDVSVFEKYLWIINDHNIVSEYEPKYKIKYSIKHNQNLSLMIEIM